MSRAYEDAGTVNGTPAPSAPPPSPESVIDAQVRQIVGVVLRGLLMSAPNIPADVLIKSICRQTGSLVAGSLQGDVATLLKLRASFKEAFADGVNKAPLQAPVAPQPGV